MLTPVLPFYSCARVPCIPMAYAGNSASLISRPLWKSILQTSLAAMEPGDPLTLGKSPGSVASRWNGQPMRVTPALPDQAVNRNNPPVL